MIEAFTVYIPELIGGVLIALLTFWLTSRAEKSKSNLQ